MILYLILLVLLGIAFGDPFAWIFWGLVAAGAFCLYGIFAIFSDGGDG